MRPIFSTFRVKEETSKILNKAYCHELTCIHCIRRLLRTLPDIIPRCRFFSISGAAIPDGCRGFYDRLLKIHERVEAAQNEALPSTRSTSNYRMLTTTLVKTS
ncbi:hypothetical protein Naga_100010g81 [Nannochloropsis gaditana]|uniref:Uncharacterized protein n=1 Tax=Nannochloropsis gaditana TaxID=72520 RepID=W7U3C8_9STRA|nr:hypothetical protein Naga_100010g81 [Nannochloropsis gaditana]